MTSSPDSGKNASTPSLAESKPVLIAKGTKDLILKRHAAQVNGHDLTKCEGWEGPLTPEERQRGVYEWYTFYACERCGLEIDAPLRRWERVECTPLKDR